MRIFILMLCFSGMVLFSGCISSSGMLRSRKANKTDKIDIDIAPPRRVIKDVQYTFLDTLNEGNELLLKDSDFEKGISGSSMASSHSAANEPYFRVQVFASNSIETIREQKKNLERNAEVPVVIDYEAPYYKLFAGRYSRRKEAQTMLSKLKKKGYLDAWIVATKDKP